MKDYSPEESGHIVAQEKVHMSSGNYETRSSKLADENAKRRVEFELATIIYGF